MAHNAAMPTAAAYRPRRPLTFLVPMALWLLAGFLVYGSTGHDDSHINFWNVHTLLAQGELVNYNGERVEQTTSLLQDLITAAAAAILPIPLVTLGYLVDILAALLAGWLGLSVARTLAPNLAGWAPALAYSSSAFLLWTYGGMGATLTACCLLAAIRFWWHWLVTPALGGREYAGLAACLAGLVLVRPEMPVLLPAIPLVLTLLYGRHPLLRTRCLALLAGTGLAGFLLLWGQHAYFGSWLPIPAVAKQGSALADQWLRGTRYLLFHGLSNPVLPLFWLLAAPVVVFRLVRHHWLAPSPLPEPVPVLTTITLCVALAYSGFVWAAGGDWMQAGRFLVPVVLPASLCLLAACASLPGTRWPHGALGLLVLAQLALQYPVIARESHGIPLWVATRITAEHQQRYGLFEQLNQEHVRDMAVIDHLAEIIPPLRNHLQRPVNLMSGQAGMVFYYTALRFYGEVHFRDLRGLVESSLTLCPVLHDIPRSPQGLFWGYRDFFNRLTALEQQCQIQRPDIIYDLNDMNQRLGKTLEPLGYRLVHRETGFIVENRTALPYNRLLSPNMIFVREDLVPFLPDPGPRVVDYNQIPLHSRLNP